MKNFIFIALTSIAIMNACSRAFASDLDDLEVYINCRKAMRGQIECEKTKGYKPWFKKAFQRCLDENGHFDRDIGDDDLDCGNLE